MTIRRRRPPVEVIDIKIGDKEITTLRKLCDWYGPQEVAKQVEVDVSTLYRVMAGFNVHARPSTARAFKRFFAGFYSENNTVK